MRRPLVLGGGLAGAAVATLLARAGCEVTLLEQYAEPRHKMCGEFLSTEACESLGRMGLEVTALGAVPVYTMRISGGGRSVARALPFAAYSLTRRVLDEAMLSLAEESGVEVRRGVRVEALKRGAGGDERWRVRTSTGDEMWAADVFVASGKHDLRGHPRPEPTRVGPRALIAFKQYFRLREEQAAKLEGAIELLLFEGGYAGLQMVEGGCANLCLLVEAGRYKALGGAWADLLAGMKRECAVLQERLRGAVAELERPLSLSRIPYGYLRAETEAGVWPLGDQAAVIPSFSGDGMSIALHTAGVAAEMYLGGAGPQAMAGRLRRELGGLMQRATIISSLLVARAGQPLVLGAVRAMPSLLGGAAALTRIPKRARAHPAR